MALSIVPAARPWHVFLVTRPFRTAVDLRNRLSLFSYVIGRTAIVEAGEGTK
jgi:hypothetical protein